MRGGGCVRTSGRRGRPRCCVNAGAAGRRPGRPGWWSPSSGRRARSRCPARRGRRCSPVPRSPGKARAVRAVLEGPGVARARVRWAAARPVRAPALAPGRRAPEPAGARAAAWAVQAQAQADLALVLVPVPGRKVPAPDRAAPVPDRGPGPALAPAPAPATDTAGEAAAGSWSLGRRPTPRARRPASPPRLPPPVGQEALRSPVRPTAPNQPQLHAKGRPTCTDADFAPCG